MCGIIGYTGSKKALPVLLDGLSALEYRGYDSAGVAFFCDDRLGCIKTKGRIDALREKCDNDTLTHCGIGHTRWATHGAPSDVNSHPHGTDRMFIVHNGIIENYAELKEELCQKGYEFVSETDTEVAAKLIDYCYEESSDPTVALKMAADRFRGSFAIAAIFEGYEGIIFGIRRDNPMLIALSDMGNFLTSDISAVLCHTDRFIRTNDMETVVVRSDSVEIYSENGELVTRQEEKAEWGRDAAKKGGFEHFMLKEIHEEPTAVTHTLSPRITDSLPAFDSPLLTKERVKSYSHIHIVACGTAYHAGLIASFALLKLARIRSTVDLASEFRYNNPIIDKNDLVIVISQSGETADTLAALRLAKEKGAAVLGIVNVAGSSVAREADDVLYTLCGPEIAVASTKAYTVQISLMYLLAVHFALVSEKISVEKARNYTEELFLRGPEKIKSVITKKENLQQIAEEFKTSHSIFFIGRGIDYALCCEAALKCKEISYIHCEAYAAGELKHGTISLVEEGTPVVAIMTDPDTVDKMISNIKEVKTRGARVLLLTCEGLAYPDEIADIVVTLDAVKPLLSPIETATAAQLLAYYLSYSLGIDVDKPRNLAKSVTVE